MAFNLREALDHYKLEKEKDFQGNLLAYAMGSSGDFSYDRDSGELDFTPGGKMPSKTEAWNSYIQMKGGNINAQDIARFNALYANAQQMQVQNQLQELQKFELQGADPEDIQDLVKQNPQMYNNMLDMITTLENTPDAQGFEGQNALAAGNMKKYIPGPEKSYWEQGTEFAGDHWMKLLGGGIAGKYAYGKLATPETAQFFKGYLKNPKAQAELDKLLKSGKYRIQDGRLQYTRTKDVQAKTKTGRPRMKGGKPVMTKVQSWINVPETGGLPGLKSKQDIYTASKAKSARNILKHPSATIPVSILAAYGGEIGEALGGEDGETVGQVAGGSYLAGSAANRARQLGLLQKISNRLPAFLTKAGARHAAATGAAAATGPAAPWTATALNLGGLALDAYYGYDMLRDAMTSDE